MNIFSYDSYLMRFLNLVANLLILHVMWLIYSLPLVTIGASTTALYYSCMKLIRTKEGYVHRNFHQAFCKNFKQATIIWIGMVIVGLLYVTDIRFGMYLNNMAGKIMIVSCSIFLFPILLTSLYIFPVQAKFENKIIDNIKNAFIFSFKHIFCSILLLLLIATFALLTISFVPFIGLMLCCGAGLLGWFTSNIYIYVFRKYVPDEIEIDIEKSGERFE